MNDDGQVPEWINRWFNGWSPTLAEIRVRRRLAVAERFVAEQRRIWGRSWTAKVSR